MLLRNALISQETKRIADAQAVRRANPTNVEVWRSTGRVIDESLARIHALSGRIDRSAVKSL